MSLDDLLRMSKSRSELVATFISVLELCKSGAIVIFGNEDDLSVALGDETTDDTGETEDTEEEEA
jgi:segregation and condensation protein A